MIKINTSGDYVQLIYVDPVQESVQQELKSDTDAFECSYDSDQKLFMQFGAMRFENPDPTDFTINGVAVTDAADFISKLNALFTGGGGGGWGTNGTIATLSGDGTVDQNTHELTFTNGNILLQGNTIVQLVIGITNLHVSLSSGDDEVDMQNVAGSVLRVSEDEDWTLIRYHDVNTQIVLNGDGITFTGTLNLPTQAAPSAPNDGDMWREDNTDTGLKIRINGFTKTIVVA